MLTRLLVVLIVVKVATTMLVVVGSGTNVSVASPMVSASTGIADEPTLPPTMFNLPPMRLMAPVPALVALTMLLLQMTEPLVIFKLPVAALPPLKFTSDMPPEPTMSVPAAPTFKVPFAWSKDALPEQIAMLIVVASTVPVSKLNAPVPILLPLIVPLTIDSPRVKVPSFISTELPFRFKIPVMELALMVPLRLWLATVMVQRSASVPPTPRNRRALPLPGNCTVQLPLPALMLNVPTLMMLVGAPKVSVPVAVLLVEATLAFQVPAVITLV